MAIAFSDNVRIYHLLDSEFREYRSLGLKGCSKLKFSNGGQYLACVDLKEISILYSYTLEKPKKIQCFSGVNSMAFNFNDTIVTVASKDGFLQKYDLTKFQKTPESVIDKKCNFKHCIFVQGDD